MSEPSEEAMEIERRATLALEIIAKTKECDASAPAMIKFAADTLKAIRSGENLSSFIPKTF